MLILTYLLIQKCFKVVLAIRLKSAVKELKKMQFYYVFEKKALCENLNNI